MSAIAPGTRLGRYEVHQYLGRGAVGPVHRAYGPADAQVDVQALVDLPAASRARLREIGPRLVALRHPNLKRVLEVGEREGTPYVVSEKVGGATLESWLWTVPMGVDGVLAVLRDVGRGLDFAHAEGLAHGRLQPERVLLPPNRETLLADVGLEPLWPPGRDDTTAEHAAYLAPEQRNAGAATPAADRFALATVAYRLLTGSAPAAEPVPPSRRNRKLGPATDEVLLRGLARDPAARWPTCAELVDALAAALRRDAGGRAAVLPARAQPRWLMAVGAAAVLALVAVLGALAWLALRPMVGG